MVDMIHGLAGKRLKPLTGSSFRMDSTSGAASGVAQPVLSGLDAIRTSRGYLTYLRIRANAEVTNILPVTCLMPINAILPGFLVLERGWDGMPLSRWRGYSLWPSTAP